MSTKKKEEPGTAVLEQEEKLTISKVKVTNKDKSLTIICDESKVMPSGKILVSKGVERPGNQPVHEDFLETLQLFVPHFLMTVGMPGHLDYTADYLKKKKALNDHEIEGFLVSGFSLNDDGNIVITGGIKNKSGKIAALNGNLTSIDPETSSYVFAKELLVLVETVFEHCSDYFIDGKFGQGAQNELDLNVGGEAGEL